MESEVRPTVARGFHEATTYHLVSGTIAMGEPSDMRLALGLQDESIKPPPFKDTSALTAVALPAEPGGPAPSALDALAGSSAGECTADAVPDLARLARLAKWSNGIIRRVEQFGETREFRGYSCSGALYHLELYFVCADLPGLRAGVYHYSVRDDTFRRVRDGDHRATVVAATGDEPAISTAPVVVVCTSTFWRNAWRYRDRSYRHALWDVGTLSATFASVAASESLPLRVVLGFADRAVNDLVGVDGEREAALALFAVGRSSDPIPDAPRSGLLSAVAGPLPGEIDHLWITRMHHASSLASGADARAWRSAAPDGADVGAVPADAIPLAPGTAAGRARDGITEVLRRRRSYHSYDTGQPLPFDRFSVVLAHATNGLPIDVLGPESRPPVSLFLVVNSVDGLDAGTYAVHAGGQAIELLDAGDRRPDALVAACGNIAAGEAHVVVYGIAALDPLIRRSGDRGYRLLQVAAGMVVGRVQLAAHAVDLGGAAMSCVDGKALELFGSRADGGSFLISAAFGHHRKLESGRLGA